MPKNSPAQNLLLKRLRAAGAAGLAVDGLHDSTLASLVRRGHAYISFGKAYPCHRTEWPEQSDGPDAA